MNKRMVRVGHLSGKWNTSVTCCASNASQSIVQRMKICYIPLTNEFYVKHLK